MAIIQTIDTVSQFRDQFHRCGRGSQFSYEALEMLFNYFNDINEDVELDVIGVCCEYTEMTLDEVIDNYSVDGIDAETVTEQSEENLLAIVTDYLQNNTTLIGVTPHNTFVFVSF